MYISKERNKMFRETNPGYGAEFETDTEEDVDVEGMITKTEAELADFISSDNEDRFSEIFDAVRRSEYSNPETVQEWKDLFKNFNSELLAADGEDEVDTIISNYVKKANVLG